MVAVSASPAPKEAFRITRMLDTVLGEDRFDAAPIQIEDLALQYSAQTGMAPNGAISWRSDPENLTAPTLPHWYGDFALYLEPGIRELCLIFVRDCNWITYTSCEGHAGEHSPSSDRFSLDSQTKCRTCYRDRCYGNTLFTD